ncbi:MAG: DUF1211 domain-containing protein [Acholeplasmataceae bacterium]|nr:DUF1211 domain-containing protein [Acholeplasmataceae bacterium]
MNNLFSKNRVDAFSDGIFAIIITLLVLEIKVPHIHEYNSAGELTQSLLTLLPKFFGWIISFFTVAVIWVNHHRIFKQIKKLDNGVFWWNAVLLLWTSFIPFPTAVLGDYPNNHTSIILYGLVMSLMAVSFTLMRIYAIRNDDVLEDNVNMASFKKGTIYSLIFGPLMYLSGVALGFIHPYLSFAIYLGIPVYFIFSENKN